MNIQIEVTEADIKRLVIRELKEQLNIAELSEKDVSFQVKTKQNWKAEWEEGQFKAQIIKTL